jgi:hypothetical protein
MTVGANDGVRPAAAEPASAFIAPATLIGALQAVLADRAGFHSSNDWIEPQKD